MMLTARERRVVLGGGGVVLGALLIALVLLPYARRWESRTARIALEEARIARLEGLIASAPALDSATVTYERALLGRSQRVIRARSRALAASTLQSILQDAADASRLSVTRIETDAGDAAGDSGSDATGSASDVPSRSNAQSVRATIAATGDIEGIAALLERLRNAPRLVLGEQITVQHNPALRGAPDVLQVVLSVRAPVLVP